MKLILLPTVQSTGTWFMAELIRGSQKVRHFWTIDTFRYDILKAEAESDDFALLQVHIGECSNGNLPIENKFARYDTVEHLMSLAHRIVVPLRDPLLSLLTSHTRNESEDLTHIVNGFVKLVEWESRYNVMFATVDLASYQDSTFKYKAIRGLWDFIGLPLDPIMAVWAVTWPVINTVGSRLKLHSDNCYYGRDVQRLIALLSDTYSYLISKEPELRPFLERHGYENLVWWSP